MLMIGLGGCVGVGGGGWASVIVVSWGGRPQLLFLLLSLCPNIRTYGLEPDVLGFSALCLRGDMWSSAALVNKS